MDTKKPDDMRPAGKALVLGPDYWASRRLRDRLMVRVTARCSLALRPVYLRGKILPVSVTKRFNIWGAVKGYSLGVRLRSDCSVVLI